MQKYKGQALPIGLAILMVLSLTATVLFNTGRSVSEKARVVNAADAAAYSGLLWQSRALNFQAYTNRAMVANQVAMAQAVSLHSWVNYANVTVSNLDRYLKAVPYVGAVVSIVQTVVSGVETFLSPITEAMLTTVNGINLVLSGAQQAMYLSTFAATPEVVSNVVLANDARYNWQTNFSLFELGKNLANWQQFTDRKNGDNKEHLSERAKIIEASLDQFSRDRSWDFFKQWIPTSPMTSLRIEKRGGTRLVVSEDGDNYEWKSKDTVSLNTKVFGFWGKRKIIELPVGYAETFARASGSGRSIESCSGSSLCNDWFGANKMAQLAAQQMNSEELSSSYSGIRPFRILSDSVRSGDQPASLKLRVEVALPNESITSNWRPPGELVYKELDVPGEQLTSVSAAELFYERPDARGTIKSTDLEYANAYNPFWDVRLSAIDNVTKLALYAARLGNTKIDQPALSLLGQSTPATPLSDYREQAGTQLPPDINVELIARLSQLTGSSNPKAIGLALSLAKFNDAFDQMSSELSLHNSRNGRKLEDVLSQFGDFSSLPSVVEKQIQTALTEVLKSAVKNILAGLVKQLDVNVELLGNSIDLDSGLFAEQLLSDNQLSAVEQQVTQASDQIDLLTQQYSEAREAIITEFADVVEKSTFETVAKLDDLNRQKNELNELAKQAMNDDQSSVLQAQIHQLQLQIEGVPEQRIDDLTGELQAIVNRLMPDYPLEAHHARNAVIASLKLAGGSIADLLNLIDLN